MKIRTFFCPILPSNTFKSVFMTTVWIFSLSQILFAGEPEKNPGQPEPRLSGEVFRITTKTIGSQNFYDHWSQGMVVLESGAIIDDHLLIYNGYIDELIFQHPLTYETVVADKNFIREFRLLNPGREDIFINIRNSRWYASASLGSYYRVLLEGNVSLLVYQKVKKAGEVAEYTSEGPQIHTKVEPDPAYFIFLNDGRSFFINRFNRRTFFQAFPEYKEELRKQFRQHHLRIRNEQDLIEAVKIIEKVVF